MLSRVPKEERKMKTKKASADQSCAWEHRRRYAALRPCGTPDQGPVRKGVRAAGTQDDVGAAGKGGRISIGSGDDPGLVWEGCEAHPPLKICKLRVCYCQANFLWLYSLQPLSI